VNYKTRFETNHHLSLVQFRKASDLLPSSDSLR